MAYAFLVSPVGVLIPMPGPADDIKAVWKPFQPTVILNIFFLIPVYQINIIGKTTGFEQ